ncbi:unnamed protein product, partial [Trichobilharzia regenti]
MLGSANTGKSSLFNRLLLSDLCKSEAKESIHRATISTWPVFLTLKIPDN